MKIGTWNLAGRWSASHRKWLEDLDCDVWLLTEVSERCHVDGYAEHRGTASMAPGRNWASVFSRRSLDARPDPDPHPASAAAIIGDTIFVSSILPWRGCGAVAPWEGPNHAARTAATVRPLVAAMWRGASVWGGDWNHALSQRETAGSRGGRKTILDAISELDLKVPTAALSHRIDGLLSIDHIAVPNSVNAWNAQRAPAEVAGKRLSDHDAYVVHVAMT